MVADGEFSDWGWGIVDGLPKAQTPKSPLPSLLLEPTLLLLTFLPFTPLSCAKSYQRPVDRIRMEDKIKL